MEFAMEILPKQKDDKTIKLTVREVEVLELVNEGYSNREVVVKLFIQKRTVDFHLANIYAKLQVSNRIQAYRKAVRLGLLTFYPQLRG